MLLFRAARRHAASLTAAIALMVLAAAALAGGGKPARAAETTIAMREYPYVFLPGDVTVAVGDTVTWRNTGGSIHDVTDDSPSPAWTSGDLVPYDAANPATFPISTYSRTFTTPGTFAYVCTHHGSMRGVIRVVGPTATPTSTATATATATGTPTGTPAPEPAARALLPLVVAPGSPGASTPTATPTATATATATATTEPAAPPRIPTGAVWSDPASWGGRLPADGEAVLIPAGMVVALDGPTASLKSLTIDGTLNVLERGDPAITAGWILVHGRLEIGTELYPYGGSMTITLTGSNVSENIADMGTKFLGARDGGVIEIHGSRRSATSWTRLSASAAAGASQITVDDATGWRVGDELVVAPSGYDPLEHERRRIAAISGSTITLDSPLAHAHDGQLQTVDGRQLDERAEVGLLTRSIVIQGDSPGSQIDSTTYFYTRGFGGHVMVTAGGKARVEGVEFRHMGQTGRKGRYGGMHWHLVGDATGDYIKNSSIHDSFHRGVVTHGTNNVQVEKNVVYNVVSQAYMPAEDGVETGNAYICNLGVMVYQAAPEDYAFGPSGHGLQGQQEEHPAVFWTRNPNNPMRDNAAAGALRGIGFFYDGGTAGDQFEFSGNTAHAISSAGSSDAEILDLTNTRGVGLLVTSAAGGTRNVPGGVPLTGFTAYKNSAAGAVLASDRYLLTGSILADQPAGAVVGAARISSTTFVAQSASPAAGQGQPAFGAGGAVFLTAGQAVAIGQSGFAGYAPSAPALVLAPGSLAPGSATSGLRFPGTTRRVLFRDAGTSGSIADQDGSLSGAGGARFVAAAGIPGLTCVSDQSLAGYVCQ